MRVIRGASGRRSACEPSGTAQWEGRWQATRPTAHLQRSRDGLYYFSYPTVCVGRRWGLADAGDNGLAAAGTSREGAVSCTGPDWPLPHTQNAVAVPRLGNYASGENSESRTPAAALTPQKVSCSTSWPSLICYVWCLWWQVCNSITRRILPIRVPVVVVVVVPAGV